MECYKIENLTFKYPSSQKNALSDISLKITEGEFITICGKSGCGKSTLLNQLKPALTPYGERSGRIYFTGKAIENITLKEQSEKIAFVTQNPDNQIVCDKVWHELAFGAESIGLANEEIRIRVAETASFFGIQTWFHKNTSELSGGQKQLLNLASAMVLRPSVIILDEPAAMLDPIASGDFFSMLSKINRELGITVILSAHNIEELLEISDRIIVMENGSVIANSAPRAALERIIEQKNDMISALPAPARVFEGINGSGEIPLTVREGRAWLKEGAQSDGSAALAEANTSKPSDCVPAVELNEVFFRYEKNLPDVIRGLSLKVYEGELYAIVGGNGTGKTTALSVIGGLLTPHRGQVKTFDVKGTQNSLSCGVSLLPQEPQTLFVKKTVLLDLNDMLTDKKMSKTERESSLQEVISLCELDELTQRHPYDLSGGEQQRAALAKTLLTHPRLLLLDEPTKGLDAHFKHKLSAILKTLKRNGVTIIMVSHDIDFCAENADRCGMFFDGKIISEGEPRAFFSDKSFYTTSANRMSRNIIPNAVTVWDIIEALGGTVNRPDDRDIKTSLTAVKETSAPSDLQQKKKPHITAGVIFAVLFIITLILSRRELGGMRGLTVQFLSVLFLGISVNSFTPQTELSCGTPLQNPKKNRRLSKRTAVGAAMALIAVPLTIYFGTYYLGDRKYYFIGLLIILETLIPFLIMFEKRKPHTGEIVIISVLCAAAVAGRTAFYMLPEFKPLLAIVIIAGVCFGGETGFLTGAVSAFVSNFFFGQGPWTPWQMFAFGIIGFLAGVLFTKGFLRKTKGSLCIYGAVSAIIIYGGIMNPASVIMSQPYPTSASLLSAYIAGFPLDLLHAAATVLFLYTASAPMIEKLERVKIKYGYYN